MLQVPLSVTRTAIIKNETQYLFSIREGLRLPVEVLLFTFIFVSTCVFHLLPGAVLLRRRDWAWAVGCLVLGAAGILLFILWVAAVIIAARRARFTPLRQGSLVPVLCRVLGIGLILLSLILISWGVRDYRQAAEISMLDFYANIIINSIVGCVGILIAGIFLLIIPALRGNGLWGGLMAVPVLLGSVSRVNTYTLLIFILSLATLVVEIGLSILVLCHAVPQGADIQPAAASVPDQPAPVPAAFDSGISAPFPPSTAPLKAQLRCVSGQYAGAEFPLADGETLYLGSSPELAHLVLSQGGIAPLHGEITYQRDRGNCLLAHTGPIFLNGRELPQVCELSSGDTFSLGTPQQSFQILI